ERLGLEPYLAARLARVLVVDLLDVVAPAEPDLEAHRRHDTGRAGELAAVHRDPVVVAVVLADPGLRGARAAVAEPLDPPQQARRADVLPDRDPVRARQHA